MELTARERFDKLQLKAYSAYLKNEESLKKSASGGVASALSEYIIKGGGAVFGVAYTEDFKGAEYICAESLEDLDKLKGSKYVVSDKMVCIDGSKITVFEAVMQKLQVGKAVLFIGLGCDIAGLRNFLARHGTEQTNLYVIDLICHGPTYSEVQKQFVENLERKYKSKLKSFSVRYKHKGWTPAYVRAEFENGKVFLERFYQTDFGIAFKKYTRRACFNCRFKEQNSGDITIGDYWGCTSGMKGYNPWGVSLIIVRNDAGERMLSWLSQNENINLELIEALPEICYKKNPAIYKARKMSAEDEVLYNKFKQNFEKKGLHYAAVHSKGYSKIRIAKIKRLIKRLIYKTDRM